MKTLENLNRSEMEVEILNNDLLYNYFGGDDNLNNICKMTDDDMRSKIIDWIAEGNETEF